MYVVVRWFINEYMDPREITPLSQPARMARPSKRCPASPPHYSVLRMDLAKRDIQLESVIHLYTGSPIVRISVQSDGCTGLLASSTQHSRCPMCWHDIGTCVIPCT